MVLRFIRAKNFLVALVKNIFNFMLEPRNVSLCCMINQRRAEAAVAVVHSHLKALCHYSPQKLCGLLVVLPSNESDSLSKE